MEGDPLHRNSVHPCFGRGEVPHDRECVIAHSLLQLGREEASPYRGPRPVMFIMMTWRVVRAAVNMPMGTAAREWLDHEPAAAQNAVMVLHETALDRESVRCCAHTGEHAFLVLRIGIQERGDEHVARHAPEGIEVDLRSCRAAAAIAQ